MTTTPALPSPAPKPPTSVDIANRQEWEALVDGSVDKVQASAEKWRLGLASFVTIVTSVLILKGPATLAEMALAPRVATVLLLTVAVAYAIWGLWAALEASAPTLEQQSLPGVVEKHGTVRSFRVAQANRSAGLIRIARSRVGLSLVYFISGILLWWLATGPVAANASAVTISTGSSEVCGELLGSANGVLTLLRAGDERELKYDLGDLESVALVDSCP